MALKTLMIKRNLDLKRAELEKLRALDVEFATREAELEKAIDEAATEDEQSTVSEEIEKYEAEKAAHDETVTKLAGEIEQLEADLAAAEAAAPTPARSVDKSKTGRTENNAMNTRTKFFGMTAQERDAFLGREDVKSFLERVRSIATATNRAVSGADLTIPTVVLELIRENVMNYSKLVNRVRLRQVGGKARQPIMGNYPEAVWTEMCASLNELTFAISDVEVDGYKVGGIIYICNAMLEDSDLNLATEIITALGVSIGTALDRAILYGTGVKMPLGIVPRLAQDSEPDNYPPTARPWVDLSESNLINLGDVSGIALFQAIATASAKAKGKYSRGTKFWAMNETTYTTLLVEAMGINSAGAIVSGQNGTMPVIGGDIIVLSDDIIADGNIVGGYGDLYLLVERAGSTFARSDEYRFADDLTAFKGTARYDGAPAIAEGFVAMAINAEPGTSSVFPGDTANDASLSDLTIAGAQVASFAPGTLSYAFTATNAKDAVVASPSQAKAKVAISYQGKNYANGATITWVADSTAHPLTVTVDNGASVLTYTVNVTKASG